MKSKKARCVRRIACLAPGTGVIGQSGEQMAPRWLQEYALGQLSSGATSATARVYDIEEHTNVLSFQSAVSSAISSSLFPA